jgi:hypothetical protein
MTRSSLGQTNRNETEKPVVREVEFVELRFPSGTIRVNSSNVSITWGGNTFSPSPPLLEMGDAVELSTMKSHKIVFKFSGIDETLLNRVLTDTYHYAVINVWLGFVNENWQLVADPYPLIDSLLMSNCTITADEGSQEIEVAADSWELFGTRDAAVLATPETQKIRYPGDTGQDRVAAILTEEIEWGGAFQRT